MYVNDKSGITVEEMSLRIQERLMATPPDLVLVDYVQKVQVAGRRRERRHEELSQISDELRMMAKDMNCVVLAVSQLKGFKTKLPSSAWSRQSPGHWKTLSGEFSKNMRRLSTLATQTTCSNLSYLPVRWRIRILWADLPLRI